LRRLKEQTQVKAHAASGAIQLNAAFLTVGINQRNAALQVYAAGGIDKARANAQFVINPETYRRLDKDGLQAQLVQAKAAFPLVSPYHRAAVGRINANAKAKRALFLAKRGISLKRGAQRVV